MADRPTGRKKNITEGGTGVHKTGGDLGTGPVGHGSNFGTTQGSSGSQSHGGSSSGSRPGGSTPPQHTGPSRAARGGGISFGTIVIFVILFLIFRSCGGSSDEGGETATGGTIEFAQEDTSSSQEDSGLTSLLASLLGGGGSFEPSTDYGDWEDGYATGRLDTSVASGARGKHTLIKGDGTDNNVILVYMCGTDLESQYGMASRDLQEMAAAKLNDHVRIYVYTGGCKDWQVDGISTKNNQIYEVQAGGIKLLEGNMGSESMVKPETLIQFLTWAKKNTAGNRYDLIFWDHGGGSVSGYGYDEKNPKAGSMNLAGIDKALKAGGLNYDFIGFDACLMATVETALVTSEYADYLIASEETEPGVGWYYTDWLTELAADPGKPTVEIGKRIVDTFTSACEKSASGQKTTLSVTDLAELSATVPESLKSFAAATSQMISNNDYQKVSDARSSSREFAPASELDQVDLVHLAMHMGTPEGDALAKAIKGAVKYNLTSASMTNSYGLSVYFPMKAAGTVDSAVDTYEAIGMDADYTRMIQEAASMNVYGQVASGGTQTGAGGLFTDPSPANEGNADALTQLLTAFLSSDFSAVSGLDASNTEFLGRGVPVNTAAGFIASHHFPADQLVWQEDDDGNRVISMDADAWSMVHDLVLHMYYIDDDGEYIDLGMDNVYEFDDNGNLLEPTDHTWLAINGHSVAYYYIDQAGGVITGYVPALLNGEHVNLLIVFDDAHPNGTVVGANCDYSATDVDVIAKNLTTLEAGDELTFIADFYDDKGTYTGSHAINDPLVIPGAMEDLTVSNTNVGDGGVRLLYRFTDIYDQHHWSPAIEG